MKLPIVERLREEERDWDGDPWIVKAADLIEELAAALEPFADFADSWDKQPLRGIDDRIYSLHGETHLCLSDAKRARAVLAKAKGE